jgi:hypothetical protein
MCCRWQWWRTRSPWQSTYSTPSRTTICILEVPPFRCWSWCHRTKPVRTTMLVVVGTYSSSRSLSTGSKNHPVYNGLVPINLSATSKRASSLHLPVLSSHPHDCCLSAAMTCMAESVSNRNNTCLEATLLRTCWMKKQKARPSTTSIYYAEKW